MKTKFLLLVSAFFCSIAVPAFGDCENTVFTMDKSASGFGGRQFYPNMPSGWATYGVAETMGDGYFISTFFSLHDPHLIWLHSNGQAEKLEIGMGQDTKAIYRDGNELWTFSYSYTSKIIATGVDLVTKKALPPRYGLSGSMYEAQINKDYLYFLGSSDLADNGKPIGFTNRMNLRTGMVEPVDFKTSIIRKFAFHGDKMYLYGPSYPPTPQHPNNDKNFLEMDLKTLQLTDWKSPFPRDINSVDFFGDMLIAVANPKYGPNPLSQLIYTYDVTARRPFPLISWDEAPVGTPNSVIVIGRTILFDSYQLGQPFVFPNGHKSYVIAYDVDSKTFSSLVDADGSFPISPALQAIAPNQVLLGAYCGPK